MTAEATPQAIVCADIHWSSSPPPCRAAEKDWLAAQETYWGQLRDLQNDLSGVPILIAGDLFDKWNSPIHLVNCVLRWTQGMRLYAIPGNHDEPNHRYQDLSYSAYWNLVEAGRLVNLTPGGTHSLGCLNIHPYPCGFEVLPPNETNSLMIQVAIIHDYIWSAKTGHKGASPKQRCGEWAKKLKGYDVAVFGDNHSGALLRYEGLSILNCGTFMRRTADEENYHPRVGIIYSDGSVQQHMLDTSKDKFVRMAVPVRELESSLRLSLTGLAEELDSLHAEKLEYASFVRQWLKSSSVPSEVQNIILSALEARSK